MTTHFENGRLKAEQQIANTAAKVGIKFKNDKTKYMLWDKSKRQRVGKEEFNSILEAKQYIEKNFKEDANGVQNITWQEF